ncbi:MAG: tetratricopeptide repeat protein [Candidatus Azobacteroides sp.]|nr:tetratricopeptide repeat protein [Candidatus Azobacteroides sp.]
MNKRKLLILAGFAFLAATHVFASDNEKGIEYYRADLYGAAKLFFLQQTNQSPAEQAENYYYLGQTYDQLNQEDSASFYYRKAIELFPEYPFGYIGEGKLQLKNGNVKAADELFKKANNFAKKDPSVQTSIAEAYVFVGDYENAKLALDKARKINGKFSGIYIVEGDMLMKQDKTGEACGRYENAILFNATDKVAYLKLAQVYKEINTSVALQDLDKLVALDPNYIPAYAVYGDIYREEGKYKDALDAYEKFIAIPGVPLLQHERYAQLLYFTGQFEKALNQIKYVISNDPNNLVMKRLEAYNSYRLGNYDEGLEQMNRFLAEMPKERHIYQDYMTLGQLDLKEKRSGEALEAFQKALEIDSTKADIYKEMANAALNAGLYPAATKYYEKYLAMDPSADAMDYYSYAQANYYAAAYYILPASETSSSGVAVTTTDDADAAFKNNVQKGDNAYAEVIKRKPDLYYGYLGRANINSLLDKYELDSTGKMVGHAKPFFEDALPILLNSNSDGSKNRFIIEAYRYLANYYLAVENNTAAVGEYNKKILDIDPNDEAARKTLQLLKIKYP